MTIKRVKRAGDFPLEILQGKTFSHVFRAEESPIVYKAITAITKAAPAVVTATGHGLIDGWPAAIVSVVGMKQINAEDAPPKDRDYHPCTYLDANSVSFNDINSAEFTAYISGGYLQYNTPTDLSVSTAAMKIRDKVGGTLLASTELADAPLNILTMTLNDTTKTITVEITATNTAAITWKTGHYDIEIDDTTKKYELCHGIVTVRNPREVTT
jgi:hypothetical protein